MSSLRYHTIRRCGRDCTVLCMATVWSHEVILRLCLWIAIRKLTKRRTTHHSRSTMVISSMNLSPWARMCGMNNTIVARHWVSRSWNVVIHSTVMTLHMMLNRWLLAVCYSDRVPLIRMT